MERLINNDGLIHTMPKEAIILEERILELLDRAISLMPQKGRAIKLVGGGGNYLYEVDESGIIKYWKDRHPEREYPITRWEKMTREEFSSCVGGQPHDIKQEIYKNLLTYMETETPKERREEEFSESRYSTGF